jgi:hypothetical protein
MSERLPELVRLLHLASPALPVGAYSYSQGLEAAIESRIVRDAATAGAWIGDVLSLSVASCEAPILLRLIAAWEAGDTEEAARWNDELLATRETSELRAETCQMGYFIPCAACCARCGVMPRRPSRPSTRSRIRRPSPSRARTGPSSRAPRSPRTCGRGARTR